MFFQSSACSNGSYGSDCMSTCGNCSHGDVCDKVNGACPNGCQPGFEPSNRLCTEGKRNCTDELCKVTVATVSIKATVTIRTVTTQIDCTYQDSTFLFHQVFHIQIYSY